MPGCIVSTGETVVSKVPWRLPSWSLVYGQKPPTGNRVWCVHQCRSALATGAQGGTNKPVNFQRRGCAAKSPVECTNVQVPGPHLSSIPVLSCLAGRSAPACAVSTGAWWTVPQDPYDRVPSPWNSILLLLLWCLFLGVFCPQSSGLCHPLKAALVNSPVILIAKCNR